MDKTQNYPSSASDSRKSTSPSESGRGISDTRPDHPEAVPTPPPASGQDGETDAQHGSSATSGKTPSVDEQQAFDAPGSSYRSGAEHSSVQPVTPATSSGQLRGSVEGAEEKESRKRKLDATMFESVDVPTKVSMLEGIQSGVDTRLASLSTVEAELAQAEEASQRANKRLAEVKQQYSAIQSAIDNMRTTLSIGRASLKNDGVVWDETRARWVGNTIDQLTAKPAKKDEAGAQRNSVKGPRSTPLGRTPIKSGAQKTKGKAKAKTGADKAKSDRQG
ncbi:hypothetical protein DL769_004603 [Monosporascus sp. CRB-8-3]|nr:hypothetical protein DL769_004603 [Monosporascus sp. CRB-8-3]